MNETSPCVVRAAFSLRVTHKRRNGKISVTSIYSKPPDLLQTQCTGALNTRQRTKRGKFTWLYRARRTLLSAEIRSLLTALTLRWWCSSEGAQGDRASLQKIQTLMNTRITDRRINISLRWLELMNVIRNICRRAVLFLCLCFCIVHGSVYCLL